MKILAIYYALVVLDIISTISGVGIYGLDAERSPLVRSLMDAFGANYFWAVLLIDIFIGYGLYRYYRMGKFNRVMVHIFLLGFAVVVMKNFYFLL